MDRKVEVAAKDKSKGKVQKSKGKSEGRTAMTQINLVQLIGKKSRMQNATYGRRDTGFPESRIPYAVYCYFLLLPFAFCLLPFDLLFLPRRRAAAPHYAMGKLHHRKWHA